MRKRLATCLAVTALIVSGCGGSSGDSGSGSANGTSEGSGGPKQVLFVTVLLADANWAQVNSCFSDAANKYGYQASIIAPSTESNDVPHSLQLIEQAIAQKPDALVVVPLDAPAYSSVLQKAKAAHIPVFALGLDAEKPDLRVAARITDFEKFGAEGADLMAKATDGKATIGVTISAPNLQNQTVATKAFKQRIQDKYPGMKVVADVYNTTDLTKGAEVLRGMYLAHPDINAVWSPDGRGGIDAAQGARALRKKPGEITIIGSDHLPQVVADLKSGWEYASPNFVSCNWGTYTVDAIREYFQSGHVAKPLVDVPSVVWTQKKPE